VRVAFGFPKNIFSGRKILEIAAYTAACVFNEGFCTLLNIMQVMGVTIGPAAMQLARKQDVHRIDQANRRSIEGEQNSSQGKKILEEESYEEYEGILYAAGIAD